MPVDHGTNDVAKDGLRELLRSRRAVALVGAGVSSWAGYPVWRQLIDRLATFACEYNPDPHAQQEIRAIAGASQDDLLAVAKDLSAFLQPRHFKTFLNRVLGPENCRMHEVIRQICALPFGDILNLNLDPSLEYAHVSLDRICRNYSGVAAGELAAFLKSGDEPGHARHLIYLHGRYSDALDDIALTEDGYNLVYKQGSFVILMTAIAATRRVVFLGFGFEDKRLLAAFESTTSYLGDPTLSFLELRGIDTKNPRSRELLDALEPIRSFSSRFVYSIPDSTEVASILGNLSNAWEVLQKEKSEGEIGSNAAGTIAACAAAISKSDEIVINAEAAKLCKQILLSLSSHSQPEPRPEADESFDHPGWGAPLARIEVAEGLMSYAAKFPDDLEILDTIRRLSRDPVPAVRFQIAIRLAFFFKQKRSVLKELLTAMIASEKTAGVLGGLTQTINRIAYADPNLAVTLSRQIIEAPDYPRTIEKFGLDFLLVTLLQLDVFSHNEGSHALLMQMLDDTEKNVGAMIQMAHHVRQILELDSISEQDSDRGLFWLREIVHQSNRSLDSRRINGQSSTELISSLLKGLETVAFQIMILLDVDPNLRNAKQPLDESERRVEYGRMEPILSELVLGRGDRLYVTPPTALNLLKIFTKCLSFSPRKILHMAVETVSAGARFGFHYDQMAIDEFVEFAKVFLADNRDLLREQEAAKQFSDLLDIFARVGWPQAVQMVTTLDEALR